MTEAEQIQETYAMACRDYDAAWEAHEAARVQFRAQQIDATAYCKVRAAFDASLTAWEWARSAWDDLTDQQRASVGLREPMEKEAVQAALFA